MRLVIPVLLTLNLLGCGDVRQCDLKKRQDYPSPDTQHVVVVFEMCCYDTTGNYPHVSLLRAHEMLGDVGNVLQGGPGDLFSVAWTAPRSLTVQYHSDGKWVHRPPATTNVDGITITFQER
jgi:hypothetical protein